MLSVPKYDSHSFHPKQSDYAVLVVVMNEGERLHKQLTKMKDHIGRFDIVVSDAPSTDGSTDVDVLAKFPVNTTISLTEKGGLSDSLKAATDFIMKRGYKGLVMMDGNNKDDTSALDRFAQKMDEGFDYVQGSRFIPGGVAKNTPLSRILLIRLIHAPLFSFMCRRWFTDTTNGFRSFSAKYLEKCADLIFRADVNNYELPFLMAWIACRRPGFKIYDLPVERSYPAKGPTPTKIVGWRGYWRMLKPMLFIFVGYYKK